MKILAIETSCDDTAISVFSIAGPKQKASYKIWANVISSQTKIHEKYGGVFPAMAKREHSKNIFPLFIEVLKDTNLYKENKKITKIKNEKKITELLKDHEPEMLEYFLNIIPKIKKLKVDRIAVTYGPGLPPSLWVGVNFAKALSLAYDIPIIPVNHMEGHLLSPIIPRDKNDGKLLPIVFPALSLLVSGGHTQIVLAKDFGKYKILGNTRDDACGEAFDKIARMLELPYPGGPEISKLADAERRQNKISKIKLPRPMIHSKDYDFSFSGLKTAVLYLIRDIKKTTKKDTLDKKVIQEIAKETEDAIVEILLKKTFKAIGEYKIKTLLLGGGVSANKRLQEVFQNKINEINRENKKANKINLYLPRRDITMDNALMIALASFYTKKTKKSRSLSSLKANGNLSL